MQFSHASAHQMLLLSSVSSDHTALSILQSEFLTNEPSSTVHDRGDIAENCVITDLCLFIFLFKQAAPASKHATSCLETQQENEQ